MSDELCKICKAPHTRCPTCGEELHNVDLGARAHVILTDEENAKLKRDLTAATQRLQAAEGLLREIESDVMLAANVRAAARAFLAGTSPGAPLDPATVEACALACEDERRENSDPPGEFTRGFGEGCLSCRDRIRHLSSLPSEPREPATGGETPTCDPRCGTPATMVDVVRPWGIGALVFGEVAQNVIAIWKRK